MKLARPSALAYLFACATIVVASSCRRSSTSAAPSAVEVIAPDPSAGDARNDAATNDVGVDARPSVFFASPHALVRWGDGALVLVDEEEEGAGAIVAERLDARGDVRAGESTTVVAQGASAMDAAVRHDRGWIAFVPRNSKGATVRAARLEIDPADGRPGPTGSIVDVSTAAPMGDAIVRVLALDDGGAFVLAAGPLAPAPCLPSAHPAGTKACSGPSIDAFRISPAGAVKKVFRHALDGGFPLEVQSLVQAKGDVISMVNDWIGGPNLDGVATPLGGGAPRLVPVQCRPPIQLAYTGSELVGICPADYAIGGEKCPLPGDALTCFRLVRDVLGARTETRVAKRTERCDAGRLTIELEDESGAEVTLDPDVPGASMRLEDDAVWTGEALLSLDGDGGLVVRRCVGGVVTPVR